MTVAGVAETKLKLQTDASGWKPLTRSSTGRGAPLRSNDAHTLKEKLEQLKKIHPPPPPLDQPQTWKLRNKSTGYARANASVRYACWSMTTQNTRKRESTATRRIVASPECGSRLDRVRDARACTCHVLTTRLCAWRWWW